MHEEESKWPLSTRIKFDKNGQLTSLTDQPKLLHTALKIAGTYMIAVEFYCRSSVYPPVSDDNREIEGMAIAATAILNGIKGNPDFAAIES